MHLLVKVKRSWEWGCAREHNDSLGFLCCKNCWLCSISICIRARGSQVMALVNNHDFETLCCKAGSCSTLHRWYMSASGKRRACKAITFKTLAFPVIGKSCIMETYSCQEWVRKESLYTSYVMLDLSTEASFVYQPNINVLRYMSLPSNVSSMGKKPLEKALTLNREQDPLPFLPCPPSRQCSQVNLLNISYEVITTFRSPVLRSWTKSNTFRIVQQQNTP